MPQLKDHNLNESRPMSAAMKRLLEKWKFEERSIPAEDEDLIDCAWYALEIDHPYLGKLELTVDEVWFTVSIQKSTVYECKHQGLKDVRRRIKYFAQV